jgi:16S rRNA (guanine1516-N2)-methyltransferase
MPVINIATRFPDLEPKAIALAKRLALPYVENLVPAADYSLLLTPDHLCLQDNHSKSLPLIIDFLSPQTTYRRQRTSLKRETLARAMGLKNHTTPKIVDATAGLGLDSFILACLGFEVTLLERSPIIQALLEDGIQRAQLDPTVAPIANRLHLITQDTTLWLQTLTEDAHPDIIYLDPMFPTRTKSALVKKEMRIFHDIVGDDPDADQLLRLALTCAAKRVVVKRPRLATHLADLTPSFSQTGSSCRFDIYLT